MSISAVFGAPLWGAPLWGAGGSSTSPGGGPPGVPGGGIGGAAGPVLHAVYPAFVKGLTFTRLKTMEWATTIQRAPDGSEVRLPLIDNPIWHFQLLYEYIYGSFRSPNNTYPYAPYTDISTFMGFFSGLYGQYANFLWDDPKDRTAGGVLGGPWRQGAAHALNDVVIDPAGHAQLVTVAGTSDVVAPAWNDAGSTTTDGSITWSDQGFWPDGFPNAPITLPLWSDLLGNFYTPIRRNLGGWLWEDITDLNGGIALYANGVLQDPSTYSIQGQGLGIPGNSCMGLYVAWLIAPTPPITANFNFFFRLRLESDSQDFERFMDELWCIGGGSAKNGSGMMQMMSARPASGSGVIAPLPPGQA